MIIIIMIIFFNKIIKNYILYKSNTKIYNIFLNSLNFKFYIFYNSIYPTLII